MIRYKDTQPYNKGMKKTEKGEKMTRKSYFEPYVKYTNRAEII